MVLVRGIRSKLLSPRFLDPLYWLSMVLIHGFSNSLTIKRKGDHLARHRWKLKILRKARSEILVIGWWVIVESKSRRNMWITTRIYWRVEISSAHDQICRSDSLGYAWSLKNHLYPQVHRSDTVQAQIPAYQKEAQARMFADVFWWSCEPCLSFVLTTFDYSARFWVHNWCSVTGIEFW